MIAKLKPKEKLILAKKANDLKKEIEPLKCKDRHKYKPTDIPGLYICEKCKTLKIIK
jgi:hypothetical protein